MERLCRLGSRPGLDRIGSLLAKIGDPQLGMPYVHVAGTNGKGSTSLMIAEILIAAGYRVGRFSSPHLHYYQERFTLNGAEIPARLLWSMLMELEGHIQAMVDRGQEHPTEFEVLTALAFLYFAREQADLVVLEVGMGGTYDSTNVIVPLVAAITSVDMDHRDYLGPSLADIAGNKAGIIKAGIPVVLGPLEEEAAQVVRARAHRLEADVYLSSTIEVRPLEPPSWEGRCLDVTGPGLDLRGLIFHLPGEYQLQNLAVALQVIVLLREMGWAVGDDDIRAALGRVSIPGRLEVVCQEPLVILDAAHNPHGARALAAALAGLCPGRSKVVVMGLLDDKERSGMIEPLGADTRAAVVTKPAGSRSRLWQQLVSAWQERYPRLMVVAQEDIAQAVQTGLALLQAEDYLLITGSFYVLDEARRLFVNN